MTEFAKPLRNIALATTLGLGLAACGSSKSAEGGHSNPPAPKVASAPSVPSNYLPNISYRFFSNGTMEVVLDGINNGYDKHQNGVSYQGARLSDGYVVNIFEFCQDSTLVGEVEGYSYIPQPFATPNYPACANFGSLTPVHH